MECFFASIVLVFIIALVVAIAAGSNTFAITMACGHTQGFTGDAKATNKDKVRLSQHLCDNCASKSEGERNAEDTVLILIATGK